MTVTDENPGEGVRAMRARGATYHEIARRYELTTAAVAYHLNRPAGVRTNSVRRSDAGSSKQRCVDCGLMVGPGTTQCLECRHADQRKHIDGPLLEHARRTGLVPTVAEAVQIVGCGRSTAGQHVLRLFGRDPRNGSDRHKTRRVYTEGNA